MARLNATGYATVIGYILYYTYYTIHTILLYIPFILLVT